MICNKCNSEITGALRLCPSCGVDLGCPNVRFANSEIEKDALSRRVLEAKANAASRGVEKEFLDLQNVIHDNSHVVVSISTLRARDLFTNRKQIYLGYDKLVEAGVRIPAEVPNDIERCHVGGKLFGSYAQEITYGLLSLDGTGLTNYGRVHVRIRDIAVKDRVSFLHENSYSFISNNSSSLPPGFRCDWDAKRYLASAKLEPMIQKGNTVTDWEKMIIIPGDSRTSDEFIEAHIYGGFTAASIEAVKFNTTGANREEKTDIDCVKAILGQ